MDNKKLGIATRVIHAGQKPDPTTGAIMMPIYATSTYVQKSPGEHQGYEYSRTKNPTRFALEECVANLESAQFGFAFASGMAAIATVLELLKPNDHVIVCDDVYGGTVRLFDKVRTQSCGLSISYIDLTHAENLEKHITKNTRLMAEIANLAGGLVCESVGTVAIERNTLLEECERILDHV